jgi:hypothetical protein
MYEYVNIISGSGDFPTDMMGGFIHINCTAGWVFFYLLFYIFDKPTPVVCCDPLKSKENEKKNFWTQWPLHCWSLYRGSNNFFLSMLTMGQTQNFT